ncbi:HEAT repeat domain-containing protein [Nocardioides sp. BP30]|uniref:HEAT repeat domain-containing protein n=1 Tax=Nocardioides sp. BP30 TaxID=3036374 RepID=UPI0024685155|nr:HEAT repeat domain-containing protein [Nocardioides sp. BP30]WGL51637.1 HEAT repeat domain-containing protein [Nocardioides sp. BP30]
MRDWACFGLYLSGASSPEARDALAARLSDPDAKTRCEALLALASVGDERALAAVEERLGADDTDDIYELELEAAAALADPRLYPLLARLEEAWEGDDDELKRPLALALARCHPDAAAQAAEIERAFAARVDVLLADDELTSDLTLSLRESYPYTKLVVTGSGSGESDLRLVQGWDRLWDDQSPAAYALEQEAQSAALTLRDIRRS